MKKLLLFTLLISSSVVFSQKEKVTKGDWSALKGVSEFNLVFDYSNLEIPKFDSEEAFLEDKMAKRDEKEPGTGENFKESWFSDREEYYEPRFIETFNERYKDGLVKVDRDLGSAEYTIDRKSTRLNSSHVKI